MKLSNLCSHSWLTGSSLWLVLSLGFALAYAGQGMQQAFSNEYMVQDDVRQHVVWMLRFVDPNLFPGDLISDYFQSVSPLGFSTLYRLLAEAGIDPMLACKIMPMVLAVVSSCYCFGVCLKILPSPATAFLATVLLNQAFWLRDDIPSATPRAFFYPFFLAFLFYLQRRSLVPCLVALALEGLFYPAALLVSETILVLQLFTFTKARLGLSKDRQSYMFFFGGLITGALALLCYAGQSSNFGPIVTYTEARSLPEFIREFFSQNPWDFWVTNERSGIIPMYSPPPIALWIGLVLPVVLLLRFYLPLARKVKGELLLQIVVASLLLFFAAHALLFKLHLPSRFTLHSFRIVLAIAAAIVITVLVQKFLQWLVRQDTRRRLPLAWRAAGFGSSIMLLGAILFYPYLIHPFPRTGYMYGVEHDLYQFLLRQPHSSLVATLSKQGDYIPALSKLPVLVSREFAIPYHKGYYNCFRQRTADLIHAQYSTDAVEVKNFIRKYRVRLWLVDCQAFTEEYLDSRKYFRKFPQALAGATENLKCGRKLVLAELIDSCSVFKNERVIVSQADRIIQFLSEAPPAKARTLPASERRAEGAEAIR